MKKSIFLFPIFLIVFVSNAQNLSLSQLLEIKKKNLIEVEEYLSPKGWTFVENDEPIGDFLGYGLFAFGMNQYSGNAQSFLYFFYNKSLNKIRVNIEFQSNKKYSEYLNAIKGYGCKLISSSVKKGRILKAYQGATTTFIVESSSVESSILGSASPHFSIFIFSNSDYEEYIKF